jgi:hypothetical protein
MKQGTFFAKALGVAIALPVSGLIALGGVGAANAVTCPSGLVPVMSNGVAGCTAAGTEGDGTVAPGSDDSSSGKPVVPVRTSPPDEPSPTQPLTPMTPTPNPSAPAPVAVYPTPIASAVPAPVTPPTSIDPTSGSSASETGIAAPAETIAPATNAGSVPAMAPRDTAVQGTGSAGNAAGSGQDSYPPVLNEIKVEEVAPASDAEPFNPAGIFIAALTGLLAVLVGALVWVTKKHGAKKQTQPKLAP